MEMFLKFLISRIQTIDGRRRTAEPITNKIFKLKCKELGYSQHSKKKMPPLDQENLRKEIAWRLSRSCLSKYRILKIRSKLSFCALCRNMTIKEMFLIAILRTYQIHIAQGDIKEQTMYTAEANATFKEQVGDEIDVRDIPMNAPVKNDDDIKREQEEKGYVVRKKHKRNAEVSQNQNR